MRFILILSILVMVGQYANAQVKVDVKGKVNNEANNRANRKTDEAIDKAFDKLEEGIGSLFKKKGKKNKGKTVSQEATKQQVPQQNQVETPTEAAESPKAEEPQKPELNWAKFDFVPGDKVIFEDGPASSEENGEFPSRWDLYKGNIEIASLNHQNVIYFLTEGGIVPYMANPEKDYLPDVFTLECDVYFTPGSSGRYWIYLNDQKNQSYLSNNIEVYVNGIECGDSDMRYPGTENNNWSRNDKGGWKHISVAFTNGRLKAYMDDVRLINIPHYEGNPTGITISAERSTNATYQPFLKNVRIAEGGVKYYDRVLTDGKIIVNGIRFDVNEATIKPESYGAINKIFELMKNQPDLKFSVEGHTDGDGYEETNQTLSEERAKAVMDKLISMGISPDRLKSTGWGESKPIDNNNTPEGKANNRRVEFVKF